MIKEIIKFIYPSFTEKKCIIFIQNRASERAAPIYEHLFCVDKYDKKYNLILVILPGLKEVLDHHWLIINDGTVSLCLTNYFFIDTDKIIS